MEKTTVLLVVTFGLPPLKHLFLMTGCFGTATTLLDSSPGSVKYIHTKGVALPTFRIHTGCHTRIVERVGLTESEAAGQYGRKTPANFIHIPYKQSEYQKSIWPLIRHSNTS